MATVLRPGLTAAASAGGRASAPRRAVVAAHLKLAREKHTRPIARSLIGGPIPCLRQFSTTTTRATRQDEVERTRRGKTVSPKALYAAQEIEEELKGVGETKIKLGKTISMLRDRLPTILQKPLPNDFLAPNISLHLFPSTHPHLPIANGRAAYKAALWTSPIAWNRVPVIGHVGLEIETIRLVRTPLPFTTVRLGALDEMLMVRWVTEPSSPPSEFLRSLAARIGAGGDPDVQEFRGLFVFQFDKEGRILDHTIECAEHSRRWYKGVGSRVLRLTDRILGGIRGYPDPGYPLPAPYTLCSSKSKREVQEDQKKGRKP